MKQKFLLLILIAGTSSFRFGVPTQDRYYEYFRKWAAKYGKTYRGETRQYRFKIFKENLKLIVNCCLDKIHAEITAKEYIGFFLAKDPKERPASPRELSRLHIVRGGNRRVVIALLGSDLDLPVAQCDPALEERHVGRRFVGLQRRAMLRGPGLLLLGPS